MLSQGGPPEKLVTLYDSLAAELREKLNGGGGKHAPLLLPPRDYDTMHRGKGNLTGIEKRRALNPAIVGGSKKAAAAAELNSNNKDAMLSSEEEVCRVGVIVRTLCTKYHNFDSFTKKKRV